MRLYNIKVKGFRRFDDEQNLNVTTKLTAIVGPNEAGKTSLLKAISYFSDHTPIATQDISHFHRNDMQLRLSFFLDLDDLDAASLTQPSWLDIFKAEDGDLKYDIRPRPQRSVELRNELSRNIDRILASANVLTLVQEYSDSGDPTPQQIRKFLSSSASFSDEQIESIRAFGVVLAAANQSKSYRLLALGSDLVEQLVAFEVAHDPFQNGINVLSKRVPPILNFTPEYREISLPYDVSRYVHDDPNLRQQPSKPLQEIIRMAGLDLNELKRAVTNGVGGVKAGIISDANARLAGLCRSAWKQSDAALQFSLDGFNLDILVRNEKDFELRDQFSDFASRSDGYKQFVALQIFTFLQKSPQAILLIDEIEHHLHYDAQADLIQILQEESSIGNVIYTTHSAGSLPEDLGVGVRMVYWCDADKRISQIENKFWYKNDDKGFKPILFGMGAATLAFFPTRRALISEGPTELILLPTLLRECLSVNSLDFQIVHGLSNINPTGLPMVDPSGNRVCYLTDNDAGGLNIRDSLAAAGVPATHTFSVKDIGKNLVTTEDLLAEDVWSSAVNKYIRQFGSSRGVVSEIGSFPEYGRINALPEEIRKEKVSFCYNVLELLRTDPSLQLVAKKHKQGLTKFAERVRSVLELP